MFLAYLAIFYFTRANFQLMRRASSFGKGFICPSGKKIYKKIVSFWPYQVFNNNPVNLRNNSMKILRIIPPPPRKKSQIIYIYFFLSRKKTDWHITI